MPNSRLLRTSLLLLLILPLTLAAQRWTPFGPTGGGVSHIVEDPTDRTLYLVGQSDGLYRLRPGTSVWEPLHAPPGYDPTTEALVITAWNGTLLAKVGCCSLWYSKDAGETWGRSMLDTIGLTPYSNVALRDDSLFIVAGSTMSRLYRSGDGVAWSAEEELTGGWRLVADDRTLYAYSTQGLLRREGAGRWDTLREEYMHDVLTDGDTLVVLNGGQGLSRSFDGGETWEEYPIAVLTIPNPYGLVLHDDTLWLPRVNGVMVLPVGGEEWAEWGPRQEFGQLPRIFFSGNGMLLYGMMDGLDLQRWDATAERFVPFHEGQYGQPIAQILSVGDTVVTVVGDRVYVTGDEGATWQEVPARNKLFRGEGNDIYAVDTDSIHRSSDLGRTWSGIRITDDTGAVIAPSIVFVRDGSLFAGRYDLLRSRNDGADWERLPIVTGGVIEQILAAPDDTLFVRIGSNDPLRRSSDDGDGWESIPPPPGAQQVNAIGYGSGVLYVGTEAQGLFRSFDGGETWTRTVRFDPQGPPTDTTRVRVVRIDAFGDTVFLHVWERGEPYFIVYGSADRGATWRRIVQPPGGSRRIHLFGNRILSATQGASIQASTFTLGVAGERRRAVAIEVAYDPANDLIRWSTPAPTSYAIELYTIAGEHVMTVESGEAEAGAQAAALPELAPGVYLCTVRTDDGDAGILIRVR